MSAIWPSAVATDANLYVAKNSLQTTLATAINSSDVSVVLASATGFPTAGGVTIDNEVIFYTGVSGATITGCTRGADGTTAASHSVGVPVGASIIAFHHNGLMAEIEAIESYLDTVLGKGTSVTATEFGYVHGVTSALQTQLDAKLTKTLTSAHVFVGNGSNVATDVAVSGDLTLANTGDFQIAAGVIVNADINASAAIALSKLAALGTAKALQSNASTGLIEVSAVTNTELGYLSGVTSAIQTQLGLKAPLAAPVFTGVVSPSVDGSQTLGTSSVRWLGVYTNESFIQTGTNDATTYTIAALSSGGGTAANAGEDLVQSTTGVTTTGSTILTTTMDAYLVEVMGNDGTNFFADLIFMTFSASGPAPTVLASKNHIGSATARTYSIPSNSVLKLVMASGTYSIRARAFGLGRR